RRMERHRAAAEWIEGLSPERSEDRAEMLAYHYREALRLAEASGADTAPFRAPARDALAEASERAMALNAWTVAAELVEEALALTEKGDAVRPLLQLRSARAKAWASTTEIDLVAAEEARDAFVALGDLEHAVEAEGFIAWGKWWRGDGEGA